MRQKKSFLIALAIMLAAMLVLQACASDGKESGTNKTNEATTAPSKQPDAGAETSKPTDAELKPYQVSIVYFGTPEADGALVEEKLNEFFKEKINATVKLVPIAASEYQNRTELMMNTGEKMDLVFSASWLNYFGNVTKGAFLELDELLDKHGQGIKETLHPLYLEAPRMKGKLYAVPTNKEITQGQSFTYRKDIVDKYNIPIETINKWEDLEPWYEKIAKEEKGMTNLYMSGGSGNSGGGIHMMYETNSNYRPVGPTPGKTQMFLVDYTAPKMEVKSILDPELVAIDKKEFELFRKYYEKGYINPDAGTSKTSAGDLRRQGKLWMSSGVWKPGSDIEVKIADNNLYDYVSHVVTEPIVTTDLAAGSMFSISRTSEDPERAMMVLNYLHTDPYVINLIVHGIEGKHYNKVGDNRIEPIADSGYGTSALFWVIGSQMLNYLKPGQPDDLYINWKKFNEEAVRFPLMGFVFDDSKVKNEIAELTAVISEYKILATGAVANPSKVVDERNEKLKTAGIEKVQAELQAQIDAWWADNKQ
ncbi:ABC transporter substrate-binding protein [Paenibacillus sp. PAMC21692]|uniref:ABC transporter substrate-binding protein n=1 Tax=Paenibacillus sp. PAMC21692 TaxID=2762320 RepID=UPI00164D006A|nr:ABC transporter substrate-binding protein [Paenibacillus sp. PAMC21692]QNK58754.1 ABC transporter substrate-binding protein [Paenibacillus sp. PAMC21692]